MVVATIGLAAVAGVMTPARPAAAASSYPCDSIWTDWVYEDIADQAWDYLVCKADGWPWWDPPVGKAEWLDARSA